MMGNMNTITNTNARGAKPVRRQTSTTGVNLLITVTSIAAALTGWAIFANKDASGTVSSPAASNVAMVSAVADTSIVSTQPMPTVAPLTGVSTGSNVNAQNTVSSQTTQSTQQLRSVTAAPRSVTVTRSSR